MIWDFNTLWAKSRLFAARASDQDRDDPLFAFWSILTLEMIARAVLASVHPALNADPREGRNIMFAFGYPTDKAPKTIPAKSVFTRCTQVVKSFTADDAAKATQLTEMRNEELHSGATPFDGLSTSAWLVDYYRLCEQLLDHVDKKLDDLFEADEATAAQRMIRLRNKEILGKVKKSIATHKKNWKKHDAKERKQLAANASKQVATRRTRSWFVPAADAGKEAECPACGSLGWMTGEVVGIGQPRAGEDEILQTYTKLPTGFACFACGLQLVSEAEVHAADLNGVYTVEVSEDPASFYGLETHDGSEWAEYDAYGND